MKKIILLIILSTSLCTGFLGIFNTKKDKLTDLLQEYCIIVNSYKNNKYMSDLQNNRSIFIDFYNEKVRKLTDDKDLPKDTIKKFSSLVYYTPRYLSQEPNCRSIQNNTVTNLINTFGSAFGVIDDACIARKEFYDSLLAFINSLSENGVDLNTSKNMLRKYDIAYIN